MGIRSKLTLPLLLAFLIFMAVLHLLWATSEYNAARKAFISRTTMECTALESDITRNLLTNDLAALHASLDTLLERNKDSWTHFSLFNSQDKRLYPLIPSPTTKPYDKFIIPFTHVIQLEGETLGTITVQLNWHQQYLQARKRITQLEWYGLLIASLLLVITWFWQDKLIRVPLSNLQKAMEKMTQGEREAPLPAMGHDEIGALGKSFVAMREEINQGHHTLQKLYDEVTVANDKLRQEISKHKKTEQFLEASQSRLQLIFDSSPTAIFIHDIDGTIIDLNQTMLELFGVNKEEGMKLSIRDDYSAIENPLETIDHYWQKAVQGRPQRFEWLARRPSDNSTFQTEIELQHIPYGEHDVIYATVTDISARKKLEEEFIKIKKLESVGVLAGGIAHDFNNLLTAILGNIELATQRSKDNDKTTVLLKDAQKATHRATKLTQQLLTFSKGGDPVKEETSLEVLIRESADFTLHGSNISCEYHFSPNLWTVVADTGQVGQVIQNITLNGQDAMVHGGTIHISCYNIPAGTADHLPHNNKKNLVCIEIRDSGNGIPPEIIDNIFDPYFTTKDTGSGLGLAVCHSIITKHGGHLTVQSTPHGSTFFIYLPTGQTTVNKEPQPQLEETAFAPLLIMVMDDEEMIRNVTGAQLKNIGHKAILVKDGTEAIARYQQQDKEGRPIDLVIMDLTIPGGMGGQEAAKQLHLLAPEAKLIVTSGYSNDPVMAEYQSYGFRYAIVKPFTLKELKAAIVSACHQEEA